MLINSTHRYRAKNKKEPNRANKRKDPETGKPEAIIGHSFGGKVVLSLTQKIPLQQYWVLDSPPGSLSDKPEDRHEVSNVIGSLRSIPLPIQRRRDVKDLLMSRFSFMARLVL